MPRVAHPAPSDSSQDPRYTVERYLALFEEGVLDRDDRVELLERVVVAMAPFQPAARSDDQQNHARALREGGALRTIGEAGAAPRRPLRGVDAPSSSRTRASPSTS